MSQELPVPVVFVFDQLQGQEIGLRYIKLTFQSKGVSFSVTLWPFMKLNHRKVNLVPFGQSYFSCGDDLPARIVII